MDVEKVLSGLVRVGKVTALDYQNRKARVFFEDRDLTSGWLYVLASRPYIPDYEGEQRTEYESGGAGDSAFESHRHALDIKPWMPKINETVLTLYLPVFNADGFILGRIGV